MIQPTVKSTADSPKSTVFGHNGKYFNNTPHKFSDFLSNSVLNLNKFIKTQNLAFQSIL